MKPSSLKLNFKLHLILAMSLVPKEKIEKSIVILRNQNVLLDEDLAHIYGVKTKKLNEQVKRNLERFPEDFMFQVTSEEMAQLKTQRGESKPGRGGRRYLPYVFTEHGTVMLASVLNSPIAVKANIQIVRAFIELRQLMSSQVEFACKLNLLEKKYDHQFKVVFEAVRQLTLVPETPKKRIGIRQDD